MDLISSIITLSSSLIIPSALPSMDIVNVNAGILIEEKNLDSEKLVKEIDNLLDDDNKLKEMKNNLNELKVDNSATIIYNNLKKLIDRK